MLCTAAYKLDSTLVEAVRDTTQPEDVLVCIAEFTPKANKRRPYLHAVAYWLAAGNSIQFPKQSEIKFYIRQFEMIFFARARLEIKGPNFPYMTLLEFMISSHFGASAEMRYLMRFVRKLRWPKRRKRYACAFSISAMV